MYEYAKIRPQLFTDDGQRMFLKVRDNIRRLIEEAGAVRMDKAWCKVSGDSWHLLACVDRMVELGELREIPQNNCPGQSRVFIEAS